MSPQDDTGGLLALSSIGALQGRREQDGPQVAMVGAVVSYAGSGVRFHEVSKV